MENNYEKDFPREQRTFETRLKFINEEFSNLHSRTDIMISCVNYKLGKSLEQYLKELDKEADNAEELSPLSTMKKLSK